MTGASYTSTGGATYEVVRLLPRMLGTVDLLVAYRRRGRKTTYTAYRHEPDGAWKCLNGAWMSLDVAVEEVAHMNRYAPLVSPELIRFLSEAIGLVDESASECAGQQAEVVAENAGRSWSRATDPEYWREQADYTPTDEGDNA